MSQICQRKNLATKKTRALNRPVREDVEESSGNEAGRTHKTYDATQTIGPLENKDVLQLINRHERSCKKNGKSKSQEHTSAKKGCRKQNAGNSQKGRNERSKERKKDKLSFAKSHGSILVVVILNERTKDPSKKRAFCQSSWFSCILFCKLSTGSFYFLSK